MRIWTGNPREIADRQWSRLASSLDPTEARRAGRFKIEADRRSYVLAHAMRRLAVARALAVTPATLVFSSAENGKPLLLEPQGQDIFFSHSHCRDAVACVVSRQGPVGIDIEAVNDQSANLDLLERFVVLPEFVDQNLGSQVDRSRQFWFYWTAVEAYWKAAGTGLSDDNPRICCLETSSCLFDLVVESGSTRAMPTALLIPVMAPANFTIALVIMNSIAAAP